jgi:hypothetical protein
MSLRPRTHKAPAAAPVAAPKAAGNAPGLENLTRVLQVGLANKLSINAPVPVDHSHGDDMTFEEFESKFMAAVEIEAKKMTKADYERYKKIAKERLAKARSGGAAALKKGKVLTEQGLNALMREVKQRWQMAKNPVHWSSSSPQELAKLIIDHYKKRFPEKAWTNIKLGINADRWYHGESGGNVFAKIYIDDPDRDPESKGKIRTIVSVSFNADSADGMEADLAKKAAGKLTATAEDILGEEEIMNAITHSQIMARIDTTVKVACMRLKANIAAVMEKGDMD